MTNQPPRLAIGALSKQTGVNIETIRFYERIGVLSPPARSPGGYRLYGPDHLKRLTFVRRARQLGFTLEEVRALLRLAEDSEHTCAEAREMASVHVQDVRAKIRDLKKLEKVLRDMIAKCADGTLPECPLIEALYQRPNGNGSALKI